ncbi:protein misato homolog 1-like [Stegodyphus dumicola]|uniref:protein misato homolog 1-like n=1 Tax=Stegodyphus dumicola TaxID=202533 RepID=UPI0015AC443D|nr:protein misato homolog 1-like [Stegodyphus dumicola]
MIEDAVRRMTEECDYLQGFHVIFDAHNGFSGISSNILQYLDDEYHAHPSICFPVFQDKNAFPVQDVKQQMHRLFAILLSMSNMNIHSSFFSPLSFSDDVVKLAEPYRTFPFIQYDVKLQYHTSAIIAAAIETLTSPYRHKSLKFSMSEISSGMSIYGRKLVCSSLCLPFPLCDDTFISTMVEKDGPEHYVTSLSPFYKPDSEKTLYQSSVLRGVPLTRFQKPGKSLYHSATPEELFKQYLAEYSASSVTTATVFYEKCSVVPPFPKIFNSTVGVNGLLHPGVLSNSQGVEKVPVAASFSSSDSSAQFIDGLLSQANKLHFKEYVKCVETAYEKDDYQEVLQNLIGLKESYQDY